MVSSAQRNIPILRTEMFNPQCTKPSILSSLLPSIVKSYLPPIPSLRRSASIYAFTSKRKPSSSRPTSSSSTASGSGTRTPEMGYPSAMVLSGLGTEEEMGGYFGEIESEDDVTQREIKERRLLEVGECKSGIGWKFANQGLNLLHLAASESTTLLRDPTFGNASFARQLYIHSLTYLLRGLPDDLTPEEQLSLRSSLPSGVVEPANLGLPSQQTSQPSIQEPSLIHRVLASTIVQLFIFVQFLLPYLRYLLSAAITYERQHKISERLVNHSFELGKKGIEVSEMVAGMGDGKVGETLSQTTRWLVEGVVGGIHEGVGEGMVILGAISPRAS